MSNRAYDTSGFNQIDAAPYPSLVWPLAGRVRAGLNVSPESVPTAGGGSLHSNDTNASPTPHTSRVNWSPGYALQRIGASAAKARSVNRRDYGRTAGDAF